MGFPFTDVHSYGLFFESVLYGIYLVTCGFCLKTLFTDKARLKRLSDINWAMVIVISVLFSIATVDAVLQFYRNLHTFATTDGPGAASVAFADISDPINVVKTATVVVQTAIADVMMVYRCWVVYGRSWLAISLPLLLVLGNIAVTGVVLYLEITLHAHALLNIKQLKPFGAAFWAMTIVINVITTGLIVARIWKVNVGIKDLRYQSEAQSHGVRPLNKLEHVMRIIIESGLLYTGTSLVTFVTYITNSVAVYAMTVIQIQVVGIAFNLIIIRAQAGSEFSSTESSSRARSQSLRFRSGTQAPESIVLNPINVEVTCADDRGPVDKTKSF
ncbi:hypothetical protein DFH09DRAFT_1411391 [Mycena vulgaris]|nr:hypothetical protein DFH09DRAFT_1411391 [Mycena vulgaris]